MSRRFHGKAGNAKAGALIAATEVASRDTYTPRLGTRSSIRCTVQEALGRPLVEGSHPLLENLDRARAAPPPLGQKPQGILGVR